MEECRQDFGKTDAAGHKYDFDTVVDRRGTGCIKYDAMQRRMGREDLLSLWVADMDFRMPQEVIDDLKARVDHGIFGYTDPDERYFAACEGWFKRHYAHAFHREWNTVTPGVVYALAQAVRAFTEPGDAVIIQQPVYYPFKSVIEDNGRRLVNSPLRFDGERYTMDFDDFEEKVRENNVRLYLLCNPHNPVGRVWTRDELLQVAEICRRNGVIVFSDEIHCDFIYPGHTFTSFSELGEEYLQNSIIGTSASKTFNLAGFQTANIQIADRQLRRRFRRENAASGYSQGNAPGLYVTASVYEKGEEWYRELMAYLTANLAFVRSFVQERLPGVKLVEPEGTYLLWLDFSGTGMTADELETFIVDKARLWLDSGRIFGESSAMFQRFNIACPRSVLEEAFTRIEKALQEKTL